MNTNNNLVTINNNNINTDNSDDILYHVLHL